MKLKEGYALVRTWSDGRFCGDGGRSVWELRLDEQVVRAFWSCGCGRGCGGGDCVRDDWGYHDCAPEIEEARAD